jgi:hypothetical protein
VIAISLIVLALASWVTNDLKNTTKFSNAAQYDTALRSVTELGIQNIRYTPLMNVTDASKGEIGYCWTPSSGTMSSQIINGYSVAVWCTTAETLDAANTRVVTLYACPTTVTTGAACASSYGLKATVAFDDYAPGNSAALTSTCVSPACGYSATQEVWSWGNPSGSLVIPSTTTTVVLGVASKLAFTTAPVGAGEGVNFSTNPQVTVEDAGGNQITGDSSNVTIAITGYSGGATGGTTQGTLAGCTKSSESLGVVTFSNCSISGPAAAGTYTLTATDGSLSAATATVTITPGVATQLVFSQQPITNTIVFEGTSFTTNPQVTVEDANGNAVVGDASTVTLSLTGNPSSTLNGCATTTETLGVESFSACSISGTANAGSYSLTATETGLTSATSNSFTIYVGPAAALTFTTPPPASIVAGSGTMSFSVTVTDASGNPVTTNQTDNIKVTATGMTTTTVRASGGTANFSGLTISTAGQPTITATDGSFSGTATVTVFGFVTNTNASNTNNTTESVTGVGQTLSDTVLVLINYYSSSTTLPTCSAPTSTGLTSVTLLSASSQWSGNGSPYYGYCAYSAQVSALNKTVTEKMSVHGNNATDYMLMQVVEVTGDTGSTVPSIALNGSNLVLTKTITYSAGSFTPGDTEVILTAGTWTTQTPTFTLPSGFTQETASGVWGLAGTPFNAIVAAGPTVSSTSGSSTVAVTYGTYGIDVTP